MMNKPDDANQEDWDVADRIFHNASNDLLRESIARAIIAARLQEREVCAKELDFLAMQADYDAENAATEEGGFVARCEENAMIGAAAYIRNRK